jgi:excisionase family DNA binding protein
MVEVEDSEDVRRAWLKNTHFARLSLAAMSRADDNRSEPRELLSEPLLSAAEAGALLGIPRSSVYDYAKRGELPHVRVGKHVKFIRQDLERVLAGRRIGI